MTLNLTLVTASTRPGRKGPVIARWAAGIARAQGAFAVTEVDLAEMDLPLLDEPQHPMLKAYEHEHTKRWSAVVEAADAFVFITPEYDFFAPAAMVNAIQCLSQEWRYKAAGVVSYGGISGGLRSAQVLRGLLGNLGVMAVPQTVPVPFFGQQIGADGVFAANEKMDDGLKLMLAEVAKVGGALKTLRA